MRLSKGAATLALLAGLASSRAGAAQEAAPAAPVAPAASPPADAKKADETFNAGHKLMKDGNFTDACPKFEESQRADPASGTLLALAYCQELSGLLASACGNYRAAAQLAAK